MPRTRILRDIIPPPVETLREEQPRSPEEIYVDALRAATGRIEDTIIRGRVLLDVDTAVRGLKTAGLAVDDRSIRAWFGGQKAHARDLPRIPFDHIMSVVESATGSRGSIAEVRGNDADADVTP